MLSFLNFLKEAKVRKVVFTFGRFNPMTIGHQKLIDKVKQVARSTGGEPRIYLSNSHDSKRNPLPPKDKQKLMKSLFPGTDVRVDRTLRNPFEIVEKDFAKRNVEEAVMIVGSDRVAEFQKALVPFAEKNGITLTIESAGERDPDAEGVAGISASKMRQFVQDDNFKGFKSGLPKTTDKLAMKVFNLVKSNLNL